MLDRIVDILEKTDNVKKSSYMWNAIAAFVLALQSPILLMVVTRTTGVYDAGIYSIAIAVANLLLYVGQYGLRRYQSSDLLESFAFNEYHGMRFITCGAMIIVSAMYCIYGMIFRDYSMDKFAVIFLWCMLKVVHAYSDVLHGRMQQMGRLDVATKSSTTRYIAEMITYIAALVVTRNLLTSTLACLIVSVIVMMLTSFNAARRYCDSLKPAFACDRLKKLMIEGAPLFFSMFLNMYVGNAPKYAIDSCLTDEVQAVFNMIFMPAFVIQLVSHFIFNPILTTYAELWIAEEREKLAKLKGLVKKMCMVVLGLTVLALAVAATIALPILSLWFGTDLGGYKAEICIIMLGGGMLAYATYFSTVAAVFRIQRSLFVCYGVVSLMAAAMSARLVSGYGLIGASALYAVLMTLLAVSLGAVVFRTLKKEEVLLANGQK